jgi:NADH dehydrogenase FAD-containing subunit
MRIVILGAGFGGLELASLLSEEFGDDAGVVLIDKSDVFVFGYSKLDVMFGRATADHVVHRYADVIKPGVRFVQSVIRSVDPVARRVMTDGETFEADILVVALGADLDPAATPGLAEGGHEFYTVAGAFALGAVLEQFAGRPSSGRGDVDAFQVPASAERDGTSDARFPAGAGPGGRLAGVFGDALGCPDPAITAGIGGHSRRFR